DRRGPYARIAVVVDDWEEAPKAATDDHGRRGWEQLLPRIAIPPHCQRAMFSENWYPHSAPALTTADGRYLGHRLSSDSRAAWISLPSFELSPTPSSPAISLAYSGPSFWLSASICLSRSCIFLTSFFC